MTQPAIDVSRLKDLAKTLKSIQPEILKEFQGKLKEAGDLVAQDARRRAGWSSSIPRTVKVRRSNLNVKVVAGGEGRPHAGMAKAFENKGNGGMFRHPVFGRRSTWVEQPARPFLQPAGEAQAEPAAKLIADAIDVVFDRLKF